MNYTEMEAKVREATNNEPWGKALLRPSFDLRTKLRWQQAHPPP
jgi:hypothetical protein